MTKWVRLTLPAAALAAVTTPVRAVQFMTIAQSQRLSFPAATHFDEVAPLVWKVRDGGEATGKYIVDHVIGKHLYIDYAVSLDAAGKVERVDVLQYREAYGGGVQDRSWLNQFVGKGKGSALEVGVDIRNISGATLSSHHLAEGVKRIVERYGN